MISQSIIDAQVAALLEGVPDGADLDEQQVILINYALRAGAAALDPAGALEWQNRALAAGISGEQLHEAVTLMSSIGVHTFFESSRQLARAAVPPEDWGPLDEERQQLWDKYVGSSTYWTAMEEEIPGFLESLLRMSPLVFGEFIRYVGIPFRTRLFSNLTKELISMAADACPAHQYLPGMRMHLKNAIRGGAGRLAIEHTMRIAAQSPGHVGVA
ncbi:hypothetical protein [Streptomyces carpinensis]|uniref:Carboxymuconolactone decarboxylase family protein n=1 Tax=Streptomyces carpinensis TaxID=66369 RepID=A0ABV1VWF8_9ACTN|nr:hypothetical protein [Streptomyces carpinensis]